MTEPVDWTDPCARATALRNAYFEILRGQQEVEIRTRSLEADESVRFAPANLDALRSAWQDAEDACIAATAGTDVKPKRFAITCRHKRRGFSFPNGSIFRGFLG